MFARGGGGGDDGDAVDDFVGHMKAKVAEKKTTRRASHQPAEVHNQTRRPSQNVQDLVPSRKNSIVPPSIPPPNQAIPRKNSFNPPVVEQINIAPPMATTTTTSKSQKSIVHKDTQDEFFEEEMPNNIASSASRRRDSSESIHSTNTSASRRVDATTLKPVGPSAEANVEDVYRMVPADDVPFEMTNPFSKEASGRRVAEWSAATQRKSQFGQHIPDGYKTGSEAGATTTLDAQHLLARRTTRARTKSMNPSDVASIGGGSSHKRTPSTTSNASRIVEHDERSRASSIASMAEEVAREAEAGYKEYLEQHRSTLSVNSITQQQQQANTNNENGRGGGSGGGGGSEATSNRSLDNSSAAGGDSRAGSNRAVAATSLATSNRTMMSVQLTEEELAPRAPPVEPPAPVVETRPLTAAQQKELERKKRREEDSKLTASALQKQTRLKAHLSNKGEERAALLQKEHQMRKEEKNNASAPKLVGTAAAVGTVVTAAAVATTAATATTTTVSTTPSTVAQPTITTTTATTIAAAAAVISTSVRDTATTTTTPTLPNAEAARIATYTNMEGALLKRTQGGAWHSRRFKLTGKELVWLRSDNKTPNQLTLTPSTEIRDIKFGIKKFMFEINTGEDNIVLAASGEAEKQQWMTALEIATGKNSTSNNSPGVTNLTGRKSLRALGGAKKVGKIGGALGDQITQAMNAQMAIVSAAGDTGGDGGAGAATQLAVPVMSTQAANDRLKQKIGTLLQQESGLGSQRSGAVGAGKQCAVCGNTVYRMEEITINSVTMHKRCFNCVHCHKALSPSTFVKLGQDFYCLQDGEDIMSVPPAPSAQPAAVVATAIPVGVPVSSSRAIDNSAALAKPKIQDGKRRRPSVQPGATMAPQIVKSSNMKQHPFTFMVSLDGKSTKGPNALFLHATSQVEHDHWVDILGSAIHAIDLRRDLMVAQRHDMMAALVAQQNLEHFYHDNETTYEGFLQKLSMNSQRNWKMRYFQLNRDGQLKYSASEKSKTPKHTLQLTHTTAIFDHLGERTNAPVLYDSVR